MSSNGSGAPPPRRHLPNPRRPLPPPVAPPPGGTDTPRVPDEQDDRRPVALARPAPARPARRPPSPAALLLLCGSGVFLFLVVAAALAGAAAGRHDVLATPTEPAGPGAGSPAVDRRAYGSPEHNDLYRTGRMASVRCDAVVTSSQPDAYERFVRRTTRCLERAWREQFAEQGIDFAAPGLVVSRSERPTSPCRSGMSGYLPIAFYCPANQTVYYSLRSAAEVSVARNREHLVASPAHEYGHHIQQLVGINAAYDARRMESYPDQVTAYARLTRRLELQAQCFAGVFVGSNARSMDVTRARMAAVAARTGDDAVHGADDDPALRTHGSFANNRRWLVRHGWDTRDPGRCNTWAAQKPAVE